MHSKHARIVQSWVNAIAHWSFTLLQHCKKHIQQQQSHHLAQRFVAALSIISEVSYSFGSACSGGLFSAVASRLPNPIPRLRMNVVFFAPTSSLLWIFAYIGQKTHTSYTNSIARLKKATSSTAFVMAANMHLSVSTTAMLVYSEGTQVSRLSFVACKYRTFHNFFKISTNLR